MRFPWGAVSALTPPRDTRLTEFDPDARILFRVKVTDVSQRPGVLLAVADQVTSRQADEQPDRRIPLLTAEPDDIGDELWRIDFESEPALLINKFLPDWKAIVRSDYFRALVYPAALRMILTRILIREKYAEIDDLDDWRSRWLVFASSIPGAGAVPTTSDRYEDWIEDAVSAFARHFGMRDRFVTAMEHTL
jgi:hypothetical protein